VALLSGALTGHCDSVYPLLGFARKAAADFLRFRPMPLDGVDDSDPFQREAQKNEI
jgi:hypothetical protein